MSSIFEITKPILQQLVAATRALTNQEYSTCLPILNGSSIGGHVRHVAELYQCLLNGLDSGIVNYENRDRDKELEQNVQKAIFVLDDICDRISQRNIDLVLQGNFSETDDDDIVVY
jgi:flagellar motor switch protein FliG